MNKDKIKEIIENTLQGSSAEVDGSEGKFTANIVYEGFKDLNLSLIHI